MIHTKVNARCRALFAALYNHWALIPPAQDYKDRCSSEQQTRTEIVEYNRVYSSTAKYLDSTKYKLSEFDQLEIDLWIGEICIRDSCSEDEFGCWRPTTSQRIDWSDSLVEQVLTDKLIKIFSDEDYVKQISILQKKIHNKAVKKNQKILDLVQ